MAEIKKRDTRLVLVPVVIAVPAVAMFLFLLYPSVKAALSAGNAAESLAIHERDVTNLVARKSALLAECDTAQAETDRLRKLQTEEQIKLERANVALKTAEDLRKAVVADQMRFDTIRRDLLATNNTLAVENEDMRQAVSKATCDLAALQTNCTLRKSELSALLVEKQTSDEQVASLRKDIESLKAQRAQYTKTIDDLKQECSQNDESARKTRADLRKAEAALAQAKADTAAEISRKDGLMDAIAQSMKTFAVLTNQVEFARQQSVTESARLKTLNVEVDTLRADVVNYTAQLAQLKADAKTESKQRAEQSRDALVADQAFQVLNGKLKTLQDQLAKEDAALKTARSDVDAARADYVSYVASVEQLKKEALRLRAELAQLKNDNKQP